MPGRVGVGFLACAVISGVLGCAGANDSPRIQPQRSRDAPESADRHCAELYASDRPRPPRMLSQNEWGMSDAIIGAVNGWFADDGCKTTTVWAGAQGYGHPDRGEFFIERHGWGRPVNDFIEVDRAGSIKITDAPLGLRASSWAQRRGRIEFTSTNGVTGTLRVDDDRVTLNP
jgi:hypothetical protein